MPDERIQKVLARAGLGSRREVEGWIAEGRLTVNGKRPQPGARISGKERLCLDGKVLDLPQRSPASSRVIAYHKPVGVICSRKDPEGRPSSFDDLPDIRDGRWISVGRLDINTCGLLLFTNDGELANQLMHPSSEVRRQYAVRVLGRPTPADVQKLIQGVTLEDGPARFEKVAEVAGDGANRWFDVVIREGRKREVRRLWEALGFKVNRLIRTHFGPVRLHREQKPGTTRALTVGERRALYEAAGLAAPPMPANKPGHKGTQRKKPRNKGTQRKSTQGRNARPRRAGPRKR